MVIAMTAVGVVQMSGDQIVDVITVGDRFMAAMRPMNVARGVLLAFMTGSAIVRIRFAYRKRMLIIVIAVPVMKMAVMKVIDVLLVQ